MVAEFSTHGLEMSSSGGGGGGGRINDMQAWVGHGEGMQVLPAAE